MKITIYRGNQIGGCITRIDSGNDSIVIDMGSNLPEGDSQAKTDLSHSDVAEITSDCHAVLYTHYHGDHIGLMGKIPQSVHQYMGEGMKEVTLALFNRLQKAYRAFPLNKNMDKTEELKRINDTEHFHTFRPFEPLSDFGTITVTPIPASHSAFDAYMFLIEVDGKKILHTGDFRLHGYYCEDFLPMLEKKVGKIDVLIIEGTMFNRDGNGDEIHVKSEADLQNEFYQCFLRHQMNFVLCSSTDIDRIASIYAAGRAAGRQVQVDKGTFSNTILKIFTKHANGRMLYDFSDMADMTHREDYYRGKNQGFVKIVSSGFFFPRNDGKSIFHLMFDKEDDLQMIFSIWPGYYDDEHPQYAKTILS